MTPVGWRIYYADGSTWSSLTGPWADAPSHEVQIVKVFYAETYRCWHGDPPRRHGGAGQWHTHNYVSLQHGADRLVDYYWQGIDGKLGAGGIDEIPPAASIKQGSYTPNFQAIMNSASQEESWP